MEEKGITPAMKTELVPLEADLAALSESDVALAERNAELHGRIVLASIKRTRPKHWRNFDDQPYCSAEGCEALAELWGISIGRPAIKEEKRSDNRGDWIQYTAEGEVTRKGRSFFAIGRSSSRDPFFGVRTKWVKAEGKPDEKIREDVPLEEVDLGSVRMKCYTNWFNNAIKRSLGVRGITWEDLGKVFTPEQIRWIKEEQETRHKSKGQDKSLSDNADVAKMRLEIRRAVMILADGDPEKSGPILKAETSWYSQKDNKTVEGRSNIKDMSEAQIKANYAKLSKKAEEKMAGLLDKGAELGKRVDEYLAGAK